MRNTNSPLVAVVSVVLVVGCVVWQGWVGGVIYVVGFLAGGIGTAVNAMRGGRVR